MSVQAITWVLEHSRSEHSARLVAISMANHASGDGCNVYPSIPTIARETRLGESTVRVGIEKLKGLGEVVEIGVSAARTREFRFTFCTPADSAPPQDLHPRRNGRGTPQDLAARVQDLAAEGADPAPEPLKNRQLTVREPGTCACAPAPPPRPDLHGLDWQGRKDKQAEYAAALDAHKTDVAAFTGEHFPGRDPQLVALVATRLRGLNQEPTVEAIRAFGRTMPGYSQLADDGEAA